MSAIVQFFQNHQVIATAAVGYIWAALIGALPAPTATSSSFYQFAFKFLNILGANIARSQARVENSPNFQDAVNVQAAKAGLPPIPVKVEPEKT